MQNQPIAVWVIGINLSSVGSRHRRAWGCITQGCQMGDRPLQVVNFKTEAHSPTVSSCKFDVIV